MGLHQKTLMGGLVVAVVGGDGVIVESEIDLLRPLVGVRMNGPRRA